MNRMKQEQPIPSQIEYELNLNKNPAEQQQNNPAAYVNEPPHNKAPSSQALNKSTTMTLPLKSEIEEGSAVPEKRVADTKPSSDAPWNEYPVQDKTMWWANTSEPSIPLGNSSGAWTSQKSVVPASVPPASKDWTTLQKEQTQQLQQIVAQMNKPKKNKKKKGKNQNPNQPAGKPSINITQPIQKKPQNDQPKSSNPPASQKPNTNVPQNNNNSAQKPQPADSNKTKPQSPPQTRQSINKKPKPQYKVKESTPSEPELVKPTDQDSNNANAAASPTQLSKRQNIRQPKVWKRKDEDLNDEENN